VSALTYLLIPAGPHTMASRFFMPVDVGDKLQSASNLLIHMNYTLQLGPVPVRPQVSFCGYIE